MCADQQGRFVHFLGVHLWHRVHRPFRRQGQQPNYLAQVLSQNEVVPRLVLWGFAGGASDGMDVVPVIGHVTGQQGREGRCMEMDMFAGVDDDFGPDVVLPPGHVQFCRPMESGFVFLFLEVFLPLGEYGGFLVAVVGCVGGIGR